MPSEINVWTPSLLLSPFWVIIISGAIELWSLYKLTSICSYVYFLVRNGNEYKEEVSKVIDIRERTIDIEKLAEIDKTYKVPWNLLWKRASPLSHLPTNPDFREIRFVGKICWFLGEWVHRLPIVVIFLSGVLMGFPIADSPLVWSGITLILLLIFFGLINFLLSRIRLGFVDNFRRDLMPKPIGYYQSGSRRWSKTQFVGKFLVGVTIFLVISVIGFAAVYYSIYQLYGPESFKGLLGGRWPAQAQFVYFSVGTVATAAYGDITPGNWLAQIVSGLEILFSMGVIVLLLFALSQTFTHEES